MLGTFVIMTKLMLTKFSLTNKYGTHFHHGLQADISSNIIRLTNLIKENIGGSDFLIS